MREKWRLPMADAGSSAVLIARSDLSGLLPRSESQLLELFLDVFQRLLLCWTGGFGQVAVMGNPDSQHSLRLKVISGVDKNSRPERDDLD